MNFGRRLKRTLIAGILIAAPLGITVFLLASFVAMLDYFLAPVIELVFGRHIPGLGLITLLLLVLVAGMIGSNIRGKHVLELMEHVLARIPVFNWLYRTAKQLTDVLSPTGALQFRSVALVEYPRPEVYSIGFVTNMVVLDSPGGGRRELCSVYIPTNHVYIGDVVLVPKEKLIDTGMTLQEGLQCLLSAGATIPKKLGGQ
jgi:uncharacterized membrane protein